jgi:hypothetical protein
MLKTSLKLKSIANRHYDPLGYRIRCALLARTIFDQTATSLLQRAHSEDANEVRYSDSEDWEDDAQGRRWSWTREQKLAAIKYATTTMIE